MLVPVMNICNFGVKITLKFVQIKVLKIPRLLEQIICLSVHRLGVIL